MLPFFHVTSLTTFCSLLSVTLQVSVTELPSVGFPVLKCVTAVFGGSEMSNMTVAKLT